MFFLKKIGQRIQSRRDERFRRRLERVLNEGYLKANISGEGSVEWDGHIFWQDSKENAAIREHIVQTMPPLSEGCPFRWD